MHEEVTWIPIFSRTLTFKLLCYSPRPSAVLPWSYLGSGSVLGLLHICIELQFLEYLEIH